MKSSNGVATIRGRMPDGGPNPIDIHVGHRMRVRRIQIGLSQTSLAERIGITFQQIMKYEHGTNRIGASRLFDIARALQVHPGYFFDEMKGDVAACSPAVMRGAVPPVQPFPDEASRDCIELLKAYQTLAPELRTRVRQITYTLAGTPTSEAA